MQTAFPSPSFAEISVQNDLISFQDFVVGFSPDSVNGGADFAVSPLSGELNGRRGEPTTLSVTFKVARRGCVNEKKRKRGPAHFQSQCHTC